MLRWIYDLRYPIGFLEQVASVPIHTKAFIEEFKKQNYDLINKWMIRHPGKTPPIYYNYKNNTIIWLGRDVRRRLKID